MYVVIKKVLYLLSFVVYPSQLRCYFSGALGGMAAHCICSNSPSPLLTNSHRKMLREEEVRREKRRRRGQTREREERRRRQEERDRRRGKGSRWKG